MPVCGLVSLVDYFNAKTHNIWEGNVTTRRETESEHIGSLGFGNIKEGVTLQRVILWKSRCIG